MQMDAKTAAAPTAAWHLQLDSPMRTQVIKFCYMKRLTGLSRNGKGDSNQDPMNEAPSSPLSRHSLSTPAIATYHAGGFYEIDHGMLPPRTPIHLKSIRVVKVSEYTSLDITVSFPSLLALRRLFSLFTAPMSPQVIKFCYMKRLTGLSRNGKGDSNQDPMNEAASSPLSRQSLSTPTIATYHAGGFYQIDHGMLPPRTPIHLKSIRVVKVSEYTSLDITVSFPSLLALQSLFSLFTAPMSPQVIKFCYMKRLTGLSRNGKGDSNQDPMNEAPSSPLSRQSLSTPTIATYHAGGFYEIDHGMLPPRTPIHLKSIRVVKVSEYTSLDITVSFPSLLALRSLFSLFAAPMSPQVIKFCYGRRPTSQRGNDKNDSSQDPMFLPPSPPLSRQSLFTPATATYHAGFYEIDHGMMPPRTPIHLKSIRVVKRPPVMKFCYRKGPTCYIRNGKDDSSQDPMVQTPSSPLSSQSLSTPVIVAYNGGSYKTDHEMRPPKTPIHLKSIRVEKGENKVWNKATSKEQPFSLTTSNSIARTFFILMIILSMFSSVGSTASTCDSSYLADGISKYCNSTARTMDCCEPIVLAIDVGGGLECLCLTSQNPAVLDGGHTFRDLLGRYIDCGGLHPAVFHHASASFCPGHSPSRPPPPPQYYSPPQPSSSASSTKHSSSARYWDAWNDQLNSWHEDIDPPSFMQLMEAAAFWLLFYLAKRFWGYIQLLVGNIFRRAAGLLAGLFGHAAPEQAMNRVELAIFGQEVE